MKCLCILIISSLLSLLHELAEKAMSLSPIIEAAQLYEQNKMLDEFPLRLPISHEEKFRISSPYGWRKDPFSGKQKFHSGIDYACELATTVHASGNGIVTWADHRSGYGKCIIIEHSYGFCSIYGHLAEYYVHKGEFVSTGKVIGFVGSTGRSTGNHLHFEVRKNNKIIKPLFLTWN